MSVPPDILFAKVALPTGLRQTFTYSIDPGQAESLRPGHRVRVPFGPRQAHGYIVEITRTPPDLPRLRRIVAAEPAEELFTPEILELTRWVADYYLAPWGQVLDAALPPGVRRRGTASTRAREDGDVAVEPGAAEAWNAPARPEEGPEAPLSLFPEQEAAVGEVAHSLDSGRYEAFLLHGVTGSGKTEVYLRLAERVVASGGQVLLLVPEIAMGTQILARVRRRFGEQVGLLHSQAGEGNRRRVWLRAREGRLSVIVGARSAVFVPLPNLRLVVVDEEQEAAYKQAETPRYNGRDVAIYRARLANAAVVLGSATPSLESLYNVERGKYRLIRLRERVDRRPPARVTVCDMSEVARTEDGESGRRGRPPIFSPLLIRQVQDRLDRGEQTILFLNRRGHSTVVQCGDCGAAVQCEQCDVVQTYHKADHRIRCHYCNASSRPPETCSACGGSHFFYGGVGTQRIEENLREVFPGAHVARMDRDAVRRRGSHDRLVQAMESGEVDILLGTQMVAKGFDFPRVTLVGALQADQEMLLPDYRASERAFQLLTQVAGRAGRGPQPGEVVFQTMMPGHHVIGCAAQENYAAFARHELDQRQKLGYPPFRRMLHVLIDGPDQEKVERRAGSIRELIDREVAAEGRRVRVLGPAPMPISRLKGRYRWHLCLIGASSAVLRGLGALALEQKAPRGLSGTRVHADVDPLQML